MTNSSSESVDRALLLAALAPLVPQILGSAFNIWYNVEVIDPLLATEHLKRHFMMTVIVYNAAVYPVGIAWWLRRVFSLGKSGRRLVAGEALPADELARVRRAAVNLPWWAAAISGVAWLGCIPAFLLSLIATGDALNPQLFWHLPISFLVSAFISITHSFFLVELASHRRLFPIFFRDARADQTPGGFALSLRGRGLLWAVSAGICPIGSLLLLSFAPAAPGSNPQWFALFVGSVGIAFGLLTAILVSRLVAQPVDQLRTAAQAVAAGRLDVSVPQHRADEFGLLIGEFNRMVEELRQKERLRQTFGLHVGQRAAEQILARDPGLGGVEQVITVMFVDIRSFTARTAASSAQQTVQLLNEFFRAMVSAVEERHGGMLNKFLGDGFMALFGVGSHGPGHADDAVAAGREMLRALDDLNDGLAQRGEQPLAIGIGIHTGPAIVGSIGSPQRLEFTAIGGTVNLAARIEALTKEVGAPILISDAAREAMRGDVAMEEAPPQRVKGIAEEVRVFAVVA